MINAENSEDQGVRVTDKRRIDPETLTLRDGDQPATPAGTDAEGAIAPSEVAEIEVKIAELTNDLQRVHAEYANYRKRVDRDRELIREMAVGSVIAELLPVLDDIERAREHGELEGAFKTVGENLEGALAKLGLETFGSAPEPFDPMVHEALTTESREEVSEPTVVNVYQPGYRYATRVLRAARVAVAGTE